MPKVPNHPILFEELYAWKYMLLRRHEILLSCHLMLEGKEEYITYTQLLANFLFLNSVPLSLNIFIDPPNLEYTLSIYA